MGTSQSRDSKFDSSDEEEELEEEEEEEEEEKGFHSPKVTPVRENPAARTELLNQRLQGLSLSKPEEAGPKVKLYQHVRSAGPNGRWVVVEKAATWSFDRVGDDEEDEDEDEEEEEGRKAGKRRAVKNWALVVGRRVRVPVSDRLPLQFHGEELRVDVAYKGVWAMRFPSPEEYRDFVTEYQNCLFENTHGLQATDANKIKVYGKDFIGWAKPEAADESIWEDAEDTFEPPARVRNFRETYTEATKGGGVQSLSIGAKEHSFLVGNSGVDVFRNMANGVKHTDTIKYQHGDPYSTPKKGMLIRGESNLMLWSPAKEGKPHASGVSQLDLETGRTVSEWKFEKDGTPIQMRDMTNDSKGAQLDPSASTFLGLDDNRLCRWDMRDRHGVVQDLASPVLNWSEGHQFSRGTNFQCFASTGDGAVAVGSRDGKVRLYGTTSMRQAKTAFPGLGLPITHIDVSYDGKWILATTDNYLMLISTVFIDKDGKQKTGFTGRMGSKIAAPRLLKVSALDTYLAGGTIKFHGGQFSFVTESGKQEHNLVASVGNHTLVWEFKTVKSDHHCYHKATSAERLKECFCYKVLPKNESVVDSKFMHESFASTSSPGAPLVVATPKIVHSFDW